MDKDLGLDLLKAKVGAATNHHHHHHKKKKKKPCGKGRKKVEIKRIEDASSRMVAFSKRKKGLFNKADELHRRCDAHIAVLIRSPSGRIYALGKPSPEQVIDRFLCKKQETTSWTEDSVTVDDDDEAEEGPSGVVRGDVVGVDMISWWEDEESMGGLCFQDLTMLKLSLETLRTKAAVKLEEFRRRRSTERDFLSFI